MWLFSLGLHDLVQSEFYGGSGLQAEPKKNWSFLGLSFWFCPKAAVAGGCGRHLPQDKRCQTAAAHPHNLQDIKRRYGAAGSFALDDVIDTAIDNLELQH